MTTNSLIVAGLTGLLVYILMQLTNASPGDPNHGIIALIAAASAAVAVLLVTFFRRRSKA